MKGWGCPSEMNDIEGRGGAANTKVVKLKISFTDTEIDMKTNIIDNLFGE